jgi:hypothetical protein
MVPLPRGSDLSSFGARNGGDVAGPCPDKAIFTLGEALRWRPIWHAGFGVLADPWCR